MTLLKHCETRVRPSLIEHATLFITDMKAAHITKQRKRLTIAVTKLQQYNYQKRLEELTELQKEKEEKLKKEQKEKLKIEDVEEVTFN